MSVHPEDAMAYADQLTRDLNRIGAALERIATVLEDATNKDGEPIRVAQSGDWSQTSYSVIP